MKLDRQVEFVLAGADVVLPAVPGAREDAVFELPVAEWALEVQAVALDGVEASVAMGERDLLVTRLDRDDRPGRYVLDPRDRNEVVFGHPLDTSNVGRYPPPVATILLCGVETFFRGKLEALLPGHHLVTTDSVDWPELVIADISRVDPEEVADTYPDVPIVGFTNHNDTGGLRRANAAGFDQVIVKNALQERAAQIVQELTASVE
jgi:CheY-like chemotaxis protein